MKYAPQSQTLIDRKSPMIGLARKKRAQREVPAQKSIASMIDVKTNADPRSGCAITSAIGSSTTAIGFQSIQSVFGDSRHDPSTRASIRITPIFATSAG